MDNYLGMINGAYDVGVERGKQLRTMADADGITEGVHQLPDYIYAKAWRALCR